MAHLPKSTDVRGEPGLVRVAGWERFPWLRAGFSARPGGRSSAYGVDELNLGWTAADLPGNVAENRSSFVHAVAYGAEFALATVSQHHSAVVCTIGASHGPLSTPEGKAVLRGDGLLTGEPGVLLGIQTADCVPVLVADTEQRVVAAFHAGWRGTLARIVQHGVHEMRLKFGSEPKDLVASIGPCIGACCFAFGDEVRVGFDSEFTYASELFSDSEASGKVHMDLVEANSRQLRDAGLSPDKITSVGECTACTRLPDGRRKFFSHRAEAGFTGRMLNVIGVVAE